jgi:predicted secreted protein
MTAKGSFGTTLTWNSQTVAELDNIGGVEISVDMIDVTNHQSTSGFREFIAGLADAGEIAIEGNFAYDDANGQIAMMADATAKTSRDAVITFPDSIATWSFMALISRIKVGDSPIDGKIPFSASLKITGVPTLATSASNKITALSITTATLYPTFDQNVKEYVAVSTGGTCTVDATFATGTCSMYVDGVLQENLTSEQASGNVSLGADGSRTVIKLVVREDGKTSQTYTIEVANAAA